MSFISDVYKGGFWPLQDFGFLQDNVKLEHRAIRMAVRISGRQQRKNHLGHYEIDFDQDTVGDLSGGFNWPKSPNPILARAISTWSFAMPSITVIDPSVVFTPGGKSEIGPPVVLPIFDRNFSPDERFNIITPAVAPDQPKIPIGTIGITLRTTIEHEQHEVFFPTDRRLIAVNRAGDPAGASIVFDLDEESKIDLDRGARLHSMMRVARPEYPFTVKADSGVDINIFDPKVLDTESEEDLNALAWQLGPTGRDVIAGLGLVCDGSNQFDSPRLRKITPELVTYALAGVSMGGPFDVGQNVKIGDEHQVGLTKDGEAINALGLSTDTLFRRKTIAGKRAPHTFEIESFEEFLRRDLPAFQDAPLEFQDIVYSRPDCLPFRTRVHLRYDPDSTHGFFGKTVQGLWRWESETMWDIIECEREKKPDPELRPVGLKRPGDIETPSGSFIPGSDFFEVPGSQTDDGIPKFIPRVPREEFDLEEFQDPPPYKLTTQSLDKRAAKTIVATPFDTGFNAILARPQICVAQAPDLRNTLCFNPNKLKDLKKIIPVTARIEAFGAFPTRDTVDYATKPGIVYCGGTSQGGFAFISPELTMSDHPSDFDPPNRTRSTARFVMTPGTRLSFGVPDCSTGDVGPGACEIFDDGTDCIFSGTPVLVDGYALTDDTTETTGTPVNDLALDDNPVQRIGNDSGAFTLTGIVAPSNDKVLWIKAEDEEMTIKSGSGLSSAGNRIITESGGDVVVAVDEWVRLWYDFDNSQWLVTHTPGRNITEVEGNFTVGGNLTVNGTGTSSFAGTVSIALDLVLSARTVGEVLFVGDNFPKDVFSEPDLFYDQVNTRFGVGVTNMPNAIPESTLQTGGSFAASYRDPTATTTLTATDYTVEFFNAASALANLPDASTCEDRIYVIKKGSATGGGRTITITPFVGQTIDNAGSLILTKQLEGVVVQSNGSDFRVIGAFG